jgi:hypothetical protein
VWRLASQLGDIMQMADIVSIKPTKSRSLAPFEEFEALFSQLRQALNITANAEAMAYIGYAGGSNLSDWRKKGQVPAVAVNALKGVLADLRVAPQARIVRQFSLDELAVIFTAIMRSDLPERGPLLAKLAKELADVSR